MAMAGIAAASADLARRDAKSAMRKQECRPYAPFADAIGIVDFQLVRTS
jgi:hypothetical protein